MTRPRCVTPAGVPRSRAKRTRRERQALSALGALCAPKFVGTAYWNLPQNDPSLSAFFRRIDHERRMEQPRMVKAVRSLRRVEAICARLRAARSQPPRPRERRPLG